MWYLFFRKVLAVGEAARGEPAGYFGQGGKEVIRRWKVRVDPALVGSALPAVPQLVAIRWI